MATTDGIKHLADVAAAATWPFCALATMLFFMRVFSCWRLKNEARTWEDLVLAISWMMEIIQALSSTRLCQSTRPHPSTGNRAKRCVWGLVDE
ncbi:hypothetical protein N7493_002218 [Penicillium malachiteum]|uniref:Uncharacterized protein n=1 Tax=Penicillium malachiteum TaxID=1324776 RepID=A0AAD6HRF5_9EURO|nr:hypothetical protein N7493_002218 [Penicillium malachiteum]